MLARGQGKLSYKAQAHPRGTGLLPQEIKAAKVQQKLMSKTVAELQRNLTAQYAELTADAVALQTELGKASPGLERRLPCSLFPLVRSMRACRMGLPPTAQEAGVPPSKAKRSSCL